MKLPLGPADARRFTQMSSEELRDFLDKCGPRGCLMLDSAFDLWASEGQIAPSAEGWRVWLMMAGRGFGKTRAGAEWINGLAQGTAKRIALVAASIDEARAVMVEGVSGILSVAHKQRTRVKWEPSRGQLTWQKGTIAKLFSGDNADGLRGPEHHVAWLDEVEAPADGAVHGFRVRASRGGGVLERDVAASTTSLSAAELAQLGAGPVTIEVRQIGALAISRPAILTLNA